MKNKPHLELYHSFLFSQSSSLIARGRGQTIEHKELGLSILMNSEERSRLDSLRLYIYLHSQLLY